MAKHSEIYLKIARLTPENGELVDLHDIETTDEHEIGYKYCKNYLPDDGMSGFLLPLMVI